MRSKRSLGAVRRRAAANGEEVHSTVGDQGFALRVGFGAAAVLVVLLNEAVLALWPLRANTPQTSLPTPCVRSTAALEAKATAPQPQPPPESSSWEDLTNPLQHVPTASLRLLPDLSVAGSRAAQARRWLTFGMSSVRRPRVEYLGITLSRLFNVLGDGEETAIVVHLADFNEAWVSRTSQWLGAGFADEVEAGRLHAIHAPRRLYPLQQAKLAVVRLSGFAFQELNQAFTKREGERVFERETYWSGSGRFFIYWCQSEGTAVSHRRWAVAAATDLQKVRSGFCAAYARAPEDHEVLDPLVIGWEEWTGSSWSVKAQAGVDSLDVEAGELLKFGDSPQRQWWRTKQNLDYAFLMWYAANISDYYMQLEDDVQVVPHFLRTVRSYIERHLLGERWLMVSFSKLGFIGKFFNATQLPQLAEFLLTFSQEMPCDWLVWVWIDLLTTEPVSIDIPKDLEKEYAKRQGALANKTAEKDLPTMRDDLQLFYKASVFGQSVGPKTGTRFGGEELFSSMPAPLDTAKLNISLNGEKSDKWPLADVTCTMGPYLHHTADKAYPPGDPLGFWTSDTCWKGRSDENCNAKEKYLDLAFKAPERLHSVRVEMAPADHNQDYFRHGKLQIAPESCDQSLFTDVGELTKGQHTFELTHHGTVGCLRLLLAEKQEAWVYVSGIFIEREKPQSADKTAAAEAPPVKPSSAPPSRGGQVVLSALLAASIGLTGGALGWLAVAVGTRFLGEGLQKVGLFACWLLAFMLSLDAMFLLALTPPLPPAPAWLQACSAETTTPSGPSSIDWRWLMPGIHRVPLEQLRVGRAPVEGKRWLAVGIMADSSLAPGQLATTVLQIAEVGKGSIAVVLLVAGRGERKGMVDQLRERLAGTSAVHLLDPPSRLYPPGRERNLELALLAHYASTVADHYLQLEPDAMLLPNFVTSVQDYIGHLAGVPWVMVLFTQLGFTRKLLKGRLLSRWAEFLVMFPEVPPDVLLWGFLDVVGNETAPKSIYLATDATKRKRPDVVLQWHKTEAIIEHLGDVSSLEGKVQRHHEDYFKKHALVDTLFDNPKAKLRTNLKGKDDMLQAVYDGSAPSHQITCGGHSAPNCAACPQGHGASWCNVDCMWVNGGCVSTFKSDTVLSVAQGGPGEAFFELVFEDPRDIEAFNLRMGGSVSAPKKTKDERAANMADPDFDHTLDDAELQFGRGSRWSSGSDEPSCDKYERVDAATGREVFWRSPQSRPASAVRCVRVAIRRAQQRPLIIRGLHVRSARPLHKRPHSTLRGSPVSAGAPRQELEAWSEQHFAWVLLVSVAFVSGAFAGVLGCAARVWLLRPVLRGHRA